MKKSLILLTTSFLLIASGACSPAPDVTAEISPTAEPATIMPAPEDTVSETGPEEWELVWQDEFDVAELDRNSWTFDLGAGGWGNNELQFYTERPENVRLEDGFLIIEARQEAYRGSNFTSGRVKTQSLQAWEYGRIEARIQLPSGQGIWSAFWMLGEDIISAGWPRSGEIDIMENIGDPDAVYGTIHGPGYSGGDGIGSSYVASNLDLADDFHVYAIEWKPGEITWFLDDVQFNRVTFDQVSGEWVYDHPFFIIMNVAVGGVWPGYPDETTEFPQRMLVDYVRVYEDPNLELLKGETVEIYVEDIRLELEDVDNRWEASVEVLVLDQEGDPIEGAVVAAGWLGVVTGATTEAFTNADGVAGPFTALQAPSSSDISFCIVNVSHPQYDYNKSANVRTCVFVEPGAP